MNKLRLALIFGIILVSFNVQSQTVLSSASNKVSIDYKANTPSTIKIINPTELAGTKSRGFRKKENNDYEEEQSLFVVEVPVLEIEGIINDEEQVQSVFLNGREVNLEFNYFKTTVPLVEGDNFIVMKVVDFEDETTTKTYFVQHTPPAPVEQLESGDFYSLIIGVNDYEDESIESLDKPIGDATALYEVLVEKYNFDPEKSTLLTNATRSDIVDGLYDLSDKVTENDNVLIFYAGHGYWDPKKELGYWLPSDAQSKRRSDWYSNGQLKEMISSINSRNTLLIADACFGGSIFKSRAAIKDAPLEINEQYEIVSRKAMTSGTLTEVPDNSVFMKYLLKQLNSNKEKYLPAEKLFFSFEETVRSNVMDEGLVPKFGKVHGTGDEQGGDFIFIKNEGISTR